MRKTLNALTAIVFASFSMISLQTNAHAQKKLQLETWQYSIKNYLNIRSASSPTFSPDGTRIVFLSNETGTPQVWLTSADGGGQPRQLTNFPDRVDFVAWSPTGENLIFGKAVGGNENSQLYQILLDGSQIRPLTDDAKVRHNFGAWSHDGKRISYSSNKRDANYFDVYVLDVTTGKEDLVYQQNGSNNAVAWSFDDKQIVISHENEQLSLDNDLYLVELTTKQTIHLTPHTGAAQFENVYFLPDGKSIICGTNDKRESYALAQMDLKTRQIYILDETNWDLDATAVSPDGGLFAYTINRDGFSELYIRTLETDGKPRITVVGKRGKQIQLPGKGIIGGLHFSKDNEYLAFTFNGATYNADVWRYNIKSNELKQTTHAARADIPQSSFIEPKLIHYKTFDGREVPAWFYEPRQVFSMSFGVVETPLPVIVSVHGGPEGQERPGFNAVYQYFLSRGYAILAPNVRGSTGYGKTYTHLDDVRKREDSVKDLAYSVEWLKTHGADSRRIAVMGGSYGGYMTLAAITLYPDLWAAAIDTVGIANFESFLKNTSGYRRKLREVEYGSLEKDLEFLRAASPIYKVDRIRAPLMVIHGKNDPRVPYTESEQIVKALRDRNSPVEYVLFEDEGHGVAKLKNRLVVYPKVVEFLDKYMQVKSTK